MAAAGSSLRFTVEVAADQATQALNVLSTSFNEAGIKARSALMGIGGSAGNFQKVAKEAGGLEDNLRSLKREMVQGDRTINFFARSLNSFVPEASAAGQAIRLLADGFVGGLGLGFALQAAMAGMELLGEHLRKRAEEARKAAEEVGKLADATRSLDASNADMTREQATGVSADVWKKYDQARLAADQLAASQAAVAEKAREIAALNAESSRFDPIRDSQLEQDARRTRIRQLEEELALLRQRTEVLRGNADALARVLSLTVGGAKPPAESKTPAGIKGPAPAAEAEDTGAPVFAPLLGFQYGPGGDDSVGLDSTAWSERMGGRDALSKQLGYQTPTYDLTGAQSQFESNFIKGEKNSAATEADEQAKKMREMAEAGAAINDIFANMGAAFGKSAGAMGAQLGKLIQQAIQLGIAMSTASGPFGWLSVAAAAAAIMATVASVPEFRAAGGSVAAGRPYVVGELGPELFVPGQSGSIVPNNRMGGGLTINITTPDARSFRAMLESNASPLIDAIQTWQRDKRL